MFCFYDCGDCGYTFEVNSSTTPKYALYIERTITSE